MAIAAGDFDGDGTQDVATVIYDDANNVRLCTTLSTGTGSFGNPVVTSIAFNPSYDVLYAADVNHDSKDDVIVVRGGQSSGSIEILLSVGDGIFTSVGSFADDISVVSGLTTADVNHNGYPDIFLVTGGGIDSVSSPQIQQIHNNHNGTFQAQTPTALPKQFYSSAVLADVNGDAQLDVVTSTGVFVSNSGAYSVVALPNAPSGGTQDGSIAVGHFNSTGHPDIAIVNGSTNTVKIYLNDGTGNFTEGDSYQAGFIPQWVVAADVNGDAINDLVIGNVGSADVTVLLGNGVNGVANGTFTSLAMGFAAGGSLWTRPVVSDFNNDTKLDVLLPVSMVDAGTALTVLPGSGDGTFRSANNYYAPPPTNGDTQPEYGVGLASADLNGDGVPDFILGNIAGASVGITVFLGSKNGILNPGVNYGSGGNLQFVTTGDFNHDGKQDVIAADMSKGDAYLFLGNGDGTLQTPQLISVSGNQGQGGGLVVEDFDNDGWPDFAMVAAPSTLYVVINNHGGFKSPLTYPLSSDGWQVSAGDLDQDGNLDLVVNMGVNFIAVLKGNGDGTFAARPDVDLSAFYPDSAAIGDFNNDGKPDLAVSVDDTNGYMGIVTLLGNADGTFQAPVFQPSSTNSAATSDSYPGHIEAVDLNRDGKLDLVYTNSGYGTIGVMYGNGDGTFLSPVEFPVGGWPYAIVLADLNADGASDAVVGNDNYSGVTALLNYGGTSVTVSSSLNPATDVDLFTLTATVAGARNAATPTGTVTFKDGYTVLQTVALAGGQASWTLTTSLSSGTHVISAIYSGDSSFLSGSGSMVENVNQATGSYRLSANPSTATIRPGQSAMIMLTLTPTGNISSTSVTLSCGSLPAGLSCLFTPASITLAGTQAQTSQLVVTASSTVLSMSTPSQPFNSLPLWASFAGMLFGGVVVEGADRKKCRAILITFLLVGLLAGVLMLTGCATGGSSLVQSSPVSKTIQVVATGAHGQHVQTLHVTILVQR